MSETLLLGAGASVEAGIPAASEMTLRIVNQFNDPYGPGAFVREFRPLINFVVGGLLFKVGEAGQNPLNASLNVEDLFNAFLLLAERRELELAPFIGSWHSKIEAFDLVTPPTFSAHSIVDS